MSKAIYGTALYADARIDREAGIIRGVSVFQAGELPDRGLHADGRTLSDLKTLCAAYANGVKVKADHGSGIFDVSGVLRNFRIDGNTLRADLHILKSEENSGKLMEMAQEIPDTFGLSVSIEQELEQIGERMLIRPTAVFSVDLVTEPAACPTGLFSKDSLTRRVDATNKDKPMNPEEMLKQFNAINEKLMAFEARIAKFEKCAPDADKDEMSKKLAAFETSLNATREEFAQKLTANNDALVTKVAAEFSKVIGTTTVKAQTTDTTKQETEQKVDASEAFVAKVQEEYSKNGGSKTKAMSAAIAADQKGYSAFVSSGKAMNYSKK